jgi:hypothetical protein
MEHPLSGYPQRAACILVSWKKNIQVEGKKEEK